MSTPNPNRFTQPDQVMDLLYVVRILIYVYLRGGGRIDLGRPGEKLLGLCGITENMDCVLVPIISDILHDGLSVSNTPDSKLCTSRATCNRRDQEL